MPPDGSPSAPGRLGRLSDDRTALFVYGTLTFPDVQRGLLGRVPQSAARTATGWRAAALRDRTYPGLVAGEGTVDGLVLLDLRPDEWQVIDAFEDDSYELEAVRFDDGNHARAYVWSEPDAVLPDDWDRRLFASRHLPDFARRCAAWRDELAL